MTLKYNDGRRRIIFFCVQTITELLEIGLDGKKDIKCNFFYKSIGMIIYL
jgi:hypothetical protein